MNIKQQFKEGLITNNPVLVQLIGMCATMAITTSLFNGIGMGLSVLVILTCCNVVISLIRKVIPNDIRLAIFVLVIAGFVTIVDLLLQAYVPALSASLGVFIPLIVVNCIIIGRAEAFCQKNPVGPSFFDGIFQGLGYTLVLIAMCVIRELLGKGSFGTGIFNGFCTALLYGMIGTSGLRILVDSKVDYSKNRNQMLTSVIFVTGLSGAALRIGNIELTGLFAALSVMFWCFVGLEAFAHLASEFKNPERDFPRALMIGLLLAGLVYWGCTVVVLHFDAYGEQMAAAASLPKIVVQLFGVGALWIACVIGYLACFASLNIYIQSFARLVWSQAQHNPDHYLARLSSRHIPNNALNAVLGCCVVSTLVIHALEINLDALIIYANGIFIMIYLLCMLAGCKLLQGRYRLLAVVGGLLCVLLLAMVGWKSLYALIMLAGLWLFLPKRKTPENGITT